MATKPDVINWAPIKTGNISFLRKNANTPIPKPAKKELLADESEIKIHASLSYLHFTKIMLILIIRRSAITGHYVVVLI